jgi:hypothetical protein
VGQDDVTESKPAPNRRMIDLWAGRGLCWRAGIAGGTGPLTKGVCGEVIRRHAVRLPGE